MKELLALLAVVFVVGIGGFLYRNALERPASGGEVAPLACSTEVRTCPDGTVVGRSGSSCAFSACSFPNESLGGLSYVVPTGFTPSSTNLESDPVRIAVYDAAPLSAAAGGRIEIRRFAVPVGESATVVAQETAQAADGKVPASMLEFTPVIIATTTFETIPLGTEDAPRTAYYLLSERDVWRFDAIESPAAADTNSFAARSAVLRLLETLQIVAE